MHDYVAKLLDVIDGDTVRLDVDLGLRVHKEEVLRLLGVNAPELHAQDPTIRAAAQAAKEWVQRVLEGADEIRVSTEKPYPLDKYGRWLGRVSYRNRGDTPETWRLLNVDLIVAGLAVPYDGGKR